MEILEYGTPVACNGYLAHIQDHIGHSMYSVKMLRGTITTCDFDVLEMPNDFGLGSVVISDGVAHEITTFSKMVNIKRYLKNGKLAKKSISFDRSEFMFDIHQGKITI